MRRKFFTEEEMSILRKNPYTYKITPRHIYFTAEFKKEFLRLYNENNTIKDCVRLPGFDPIYWECKNQQPEKIFP